MNISFLLNGQPVEIDTPPDRRLVDILREDFSLLHTRVGCYAGRCGSCAVFFNGQLIYSCLIAAFAAQDANILTVEGIHDTSIYQDIAAGFGKAEYQPCGCCYQCKVLSLYSLFEENPVPDRFAVERALLGQDCKCLDMNAIMNAISHIVNEMRKRRDVRHPI